MCINVVQRICSRPALSLQSWKVRSGDTGGHSEGRGIGRSDPGLESVDPGLDCTSPQFNRIGEVSLSMLAYISLPCAETSVSHMGRAPPNRGHLQVCGRHLPMPENAAAARSRNRGTNRPVSKCIGRDITEVHAQGRAPQETCARRAVNCGAPRRLYSAYASCRLENHWLRCRSADPAVAMRKSPGAVMCRNVGSVTGAHQCVCTNNCVTGTDLRCCRGLLSCHFQPLAVFLFILDHALQLVLVALVTCQSILIEDPLERRLPLEVSLFEGCTHAPCEVRVERARSCVPHLAYCIA